MRSSVQDNFVESLYWLNKLETTHSLRVGDAALGLAELCNAQMPVLPSAVIGTESFQQFCRSIVWSSPFLSDFPHVSLRIRAAHPFQLQAVAEEIAQRFEQTDLPPLWLQTTSAELQGLSNRWRLCPSLTLPKPWTPIYPPPDGDVTSSILFIDRHWHSHQTSLEQYFYSSHTPAHAGTSDSY